MNGAVQRGLETQLPCDPQRDLKEHCEVLLLQSMHVLSTFLWGTLSSLQNWHCLWMTQDLRYKSPWKEDNSSPGCSHTGEDKGQEKAGHSQALRLATFLQHKPILELTKHKMPHAAEQGLFRYSCSWRPSSTLIQKIYLGILKLLGLMLWVVSLALQLTNNHVRHQHSTQGSFCPKMVLPQARAHQRSPEPVCWACRVERSITSYTKMNPCAEKKIHPLFVQNPQSHGSGSVKGSWSLYLVVRGNKTIA